MTATKTDVVAFTTDFAVAHQLGRPLLLGPGCISEAHTEREFVRKADLPAAANLYYRLVRDEGQKLGVWAGIGDCPTLGAPLQKSAT